MSGARVAIVDDHRLLVEALASALEAEGHDVLRPALGSLDALREELTDAAPDVALVDLDLAGSGNGEELITPLSVAGVCVVVLSATTDEARIGRCLELGAAGWVPKSAPFEALLDTILLATSGEPLLTHDDRARLCGAWHRQRALATERSSTFARLTRRERVVLGLLAEGHRAEHIAAESYVSVATVRTQIRAILVKLGVNSQLEAVALARSSDWNGPAAP